MEFNLTSILVMLGVLVVGWLIGFIDSNIRSSRKIRAAAAQAQMKIEEAAAEGQKAGQKSGQAHAGNDLLRLWSSPSKAIALELDGQPVNEGNLSSDQRRRLANLIAQIRPWLDGSARTSASPRIEGKEPIKVKKPETSEVPQEQTGIVSQINRILQVRLPGTPMAKRGIRIQESESGGVQVFVGLKVYDGLEAVPDPEIRSLIREAVEEWERSQT